MNKYVSVDIGGTNIKYGLVDDDACILKSGEVSTEAHLGGEKILQKIFSIIEKFLSEENIAGVCISSAGMIDPLQGKVFYSGPQIPNYIGINFKKIIEQKYKIPCEAENDVNCAGLAEVISGSGKGSSTALCLTIGTGIGGALLFNSKIYSGFSFSAGEVGYMSLSDGNFQDLASTNALIKRVSERKKDSSEWTGKRIFEAAKSGDIICVQEIDKMISYLSEGMANICYVINPEVIILGGGIMAQKEYLEDKINKELNKRLVVSLQNMAKIKFAHYQNNAGLLGAFYNFKSRRNF